MPTDQELMIGMRKSEEPPSADLSLEQKKTLQRISRPRYCYAGKKKEQRKQKTLKQNGDLNNERGSSKKQIDMTI